MKQLGIGIGIFCLLSIAGLIFGGAELIFKLTGGAALVLLALAVVMSGVLGSGDRIRVNNGYEDPSERKQRKDLTISLLLMAIPNVLGAIILFFAYLNK